MRNGVFGLFSLDGKPLDAGDRDIVLGVLESEALQTPGASVAARDACGTAVHIHRGHCEEASNNGRDLAVLLGDLDEAATVAARLKMPANANAAALTVAAHDHWCHNAPTELAGEWLLLRWQASSRTLTLLSSETAFESCYLATDGRRLAVAPDLVRLARLPWVGTEFDPDVLMRTMGRSYVRASIGARTILRGVTRVCAGACITVCAGGMRIAAPDPQTPPALAAISFEEAIAELDALLRRIVRQRLSRAAGVAVQMSGGLDSSLLGLIAAEERTHGQRLVFLTSAAPESAGIADESEWAGLVARHLDVPMVKVMPAEDADVYRPSTRTLAMTESPAMSLRHYLYEALADAALDANAQRLVDGMYGEMTISNHGHSLRAQQSLSPRAIVRSLRKRWRNRPISTQGEHYHVMPSPMMIASVAESHLEARHSAKRLRRRLAEDEPFGIEHDIHKISQLTTSVSHPSLRTLFPFRDPRLIRLMSSLPAGFVRHEGSDRAPIRALTRGGLPDAVVMRPKGMAFSPSYHIMLRAQADAAIGRLHDQRLAGAGEWLDLDWLELMLRRVRDGAAFNTQTLVRVQGTAYAAEFFRWWQQAV
jgi:asparagine synthase (glutamine-hydrolysing)